MKIKQALFTAGYSSFYFDDQQAIKTERVMTAFYTGEPVTQGLTPYVRPGVRIGTVDSGKRRGRRR